MNTTPFVILYTQDADLVRRTKAYLRNLAQIRHVTDADRLEPVLQQTGPAVLIMDLRAKESRELLGEIHDEHHDILIIALGVAHSEPLREAEELGIYAAEELGLDRRRFQALLERAFDYQKLLEENRDFRETSTMPRDRALTTGDPRPATGSGRGLSLLRFPRVLRRSDSIDTLVSSVVEAVADAAGVSRVGIFLSTAKGQPYSFRGGLRYLSETDQLRFGERDGLVRWFELHARLISRNHLAHTSEDRSRVLMRRALDMFGAEVIAPLFGQNTVIGWIFFGTRVTGQPFDDRDLENLTMLAEHVSTILENAFLYEEASVQKTLAETLLKSIPPGIVAVDMNATVRWFNPRAEKILGISSTEALNKPVERVGNKLAGLLREALESKETLPRQQWTDSATRRSVSVEARRLADNASTLGAVAVINDLTAEETIREKQALVDRAAFWTDLAASMSHEIRNPLVAIKTFAQLLPERFDDADFRKEFNQIVVQEIDRLDKIITQINNFAHPPELILKSIDVRAPVKKGLEIARSRFGINGKVEIETSLPSDLPRVLGDESALAEAFAHLVANAAEASVDRNKPQISLSAKPLREGKQAAAVVITVRDNGHGIAPDIKEKIFSPFCTTKPRGMGLGLPIVKRTVFDHHGRVEVDSTAKGTLVSIVLPVTRAPRD
jgi:PAS domain S-box-containing protein